MNCEELDKRIYKLKQDGKEYILSLSIFKDCLRLLGQESAGKDNPYYGADFSLKELGEKNRYFLIMTSIKEAQNELIKAIEKQQVGIENKTNLINLVFYMAIGTDNIIVKIPLDKKDNSYNIIKPPEEMEPFTNIIQLKNRGNYPEDELRIGTLEKKNEKLKKTQNDLMVDIKKLLDMSVKLINETNILLEENAKLGVRLQRMQKESLERNLEVEALKEEEKALNGENIKLKNYNKDLEKVLAQKKENLKKNYQESKQMKLNKDEIDSGNGPKAVSSRYDEVQVKTYIPRVNVKPAFDAYNEGIIVNGRPPFYYTEKRITQYLTTNSPITDKHNYTDINIQYNSKDIDSFGTNYIDFNPNNISYNTYNKALDNKIINDTYNYSEINYAVPKDNLNRKNQKKKKVTERISEKANDFEEENKKNSLNKEQSQREESFFSYQESNLNETETDELKYINSEIIQNTKEEEMLLNKINGKGKEIQFNLIYKATIDSDRAEVFHKKCDKALKTLVLIETINGKRFGGYTTQSWEGENIDKNDNEAFIFSLNNSKIYNIISNQPAIGCYPKYGPVFLGCQIKVNDNFFVKGGTTYIKNTNYSTSLDFELNDGVKFYGIKDIEVFEVNLI